METGQAKLLKDITLFLSTHKIPYMITGSWSTTYYDRPRASTATIRFPNDKKLPLTLIKKLVKARVRLNEEAKK